MNVLGQFKPAPPVAWLFLCLRRVMIRGAALRVPCPATNRMPLPALVMLGVGVGWAALSRSGRAAFVEVRGHAPSVGLNREGGRGAGAARLWNFRVSELAMAVRWLHDHRAALTALHVACLVCYALQAMKSKPFLWHTTQRSRGDGDGDCWADEGWRPLIGGIRRFAVIRTPPLPYLPSPLFTSALLTTQHPPSSTLTHNHRHSITGQRAPSAAAFSQTTTTRRPSDAHTHRHRHRHTLLLLLLFFLTMVLSRGQAAAAAVTRVFTLSDQTRLQIKMGDLTKAAVGAIVNAANEQMLGGGGVDGAIHRAAGPRLYDACKAVPEVTPGVRCPTGEARITPGFELPSSFVVHTVGPVYENDAESAPLLRASHRSSLELAARKGLASVAFPAISCGIYGYPASKAARIAVQTCLDFSKEQVSFGEGGGREGACVEPANKFC